MATDLAALRDGSRPLVREIPHVVSPGLWVLAWRELRRRDLLQGIRPTLKPDKLPGAWRFAIHVNLTSSLQTSLGSSLGLASSRGFSRTGTYAELCISSEAQVHPIPEALSFSQAAIGCRL